MSRPCARSILAVIGIAGLMTAPALSAQESEWSWSLIPYLWGAGIEMDVAVDEEDVIMAKADFDDILDRLDFAGQVHFEGQRGPAGFFVDLQFFDFDDDERTFQGGQLPASVSAKGDLEMWLVEAGGLYSPGKDLTGFAVLYGIRMYSVDQEIDFEVSTMGSPTGRVEFDDTLVDGLVGVRYTHRFGTGWSIGGRGDVSAGDTEVTWNALAHAGYSFGESDRYTVLFGYRQMVIDFEDGETRSGSSIEPELTMSGPFAAFRIGF